MAGFRKLNDHYIVKEPISEGAFGVVYKGTDRVTGEMVALKKLKKIELDKHQVLPFIVRREVKILEKLKHHENVIGFIEVVTCSDEKEVYLVFEYMENDLAQLARQMIFTPVEIKYYMRQLLTGLAYIHEKEVIHRDLKGANILVDKDRKLLKVADFGMSRFLKDDDTDTQSIVAGDFPETHALLGDLLVIFTNPIMEMPYRPPEILLASTSYGLEVDIWAVGCLFAELLNGGSKIFPSQEKDEQLQKMFQVCGTPDIDKWPELYELMGDAASDLPKPPVESRVRHEFAHFDPDAIELLDKMLVMNPTKRISAADALAGTYFSTEP